VPAGNPASRRLEHRVAGADANPYLLFAVVLSAILDGIEQNLSPGDPIVGDGYAQENDALPVYMPDAVNLFRQSDFIRNALGEEMQRIYTLTKQQEIEEFRRRISLLEYQSYLKQL
jgi:glutamine synthetase